MEPSAKRKFGRSDLEVTAFSYGAAQVGNFFRTISEAESHKMFDTAWEAGVRYFDTAPFYGHGLSELRTGQGLRWRPRDAFLVSTKVGRVLTPAPRSEIDFSPWVDAAPFKFHYDYSYDGTMRSFEDSLQRLALERIDICYIHDIDVFTRGKDQPEVFEQAMDGTWRALESLKAQKMVGAIGVGVNEWQVCHEALKRRDFDCFLLAGRYTLLEQDALDEFLPLCVARGAAIAVGGGFNSGILATGARPGAKYNYGPAPEHVMARVARLESVCSEFSVPLPAAALQFVTAHPAIPTFISGTRTAEQLAQNLAWFSRPIPDAFWQVLKQQGLLREDAPTPEG
jgi:D-threo-aldose 1-dehydrogenase